MLQRQTFLKMTSTQIRDLEVYVGTRCPTSADNEYVRRLDILMPPIVFVSHASGYETERV